METFPAFFPLAGRRVVIAGAGEPAEAKARLFRGSPAEVVRLEGEAALDPAAYAGAGLVFVASFDRAFANAAAAAARGCGTPLNVVDRPELSDFYTPAIVDRGVVVAAVGTGGAAPVLASMLRSELEARIPPSLSALASHLAERRRAIRESFPDLARRRAFFRAVLSAPDISVVELDSAIAEAAPPDGRVSFILEPEAEDLITVRAVRALAAADVVVAEPGAALVDRHGRRDAERRSLAETALDWLSNAVREGLRIVVLGPAPTRETLEALGDFVEVLAPASAA